MKRLPLALLLLAACGGGNGGSPDAGPPDAPHADAAVAPVFRNPRADLTDDQVALQSLQMIGAQVQNADRNCNQCHGLTNDHLKTWGTLSANSMTNCLTDLAVTDRAEAMTMVDCLRDPATGDFAPNRLGFYATAAGLPWFDYLFHLADPVSGDATYADFLGRAYMPRGSHAKMTQDEFDVLAEWVSRGMPLLDNYVPTQSGGSCTNSITSEMTDHVTAMATAGWQAVNAGNGINMFGCAGAATVHDCLSTYTDASATAYGSTWEQDFSSQIRILRTNNYSSSYWTRSSADGRFVAHGGSAGTGNSTIIDLQNNTLIPTEAYYDPGFFPDNTGFVFQGSQPHVCDQRLLSGSPQPTYISYQEPQCSNASQVGLYQHLGRALGGGDYWTVNGQFVSDNGGHSVTNTDFPADFTSNSSIDLTPLVFNGSTYTEKASVTVAIPNEGDTVISPSATMLVSRVAGTNGNQNGYSVRKLVATPNGNSYTVTVPTVGRLCITGEKPAFSYDERWLVMHHYVTNTLADAQDLGFSSTSDAGFQAYLQQGASNLYLIDLTTGDKTRLTRMNPGQYALYPHFRSDGWIYFLVRTGGGPEYVAATDAALVAAGN